MLELERCRNHTNARDEKGLTAMQKFSLLAVITFLTLAGCMSTSDPMGPDALSWQNYRSWYKANPAPNTGDPTGFLGNVHEGLNAYRDIYVNSIGELTNRGQGSFPYPEGTILVKETYSGKTAYDRQATPDLTIMIKLADGVSPETDDWEYVMGAAGINRGTGVSGLATFCHSCHQLAVGTDANFINAQFYNLQ